MLSTSTIYQVVYDYLVNNEGVENLDSLLEKWEASDPTKAANGVISLITLCAALRDDMRTESNKASGKSNIEKAMKAVIKNVPNYQTQFQGAFDCNGKQAVCDGHTAILLNTPITLPAPPVPCTLDVAGIVDKARQNANRPLLLPSIGELKAYIKIKTTENKAMYGKGAKNKYIIWDFGESLPAVNAAYLLNILTAFPDASAHAATPTDPLYFSSEHGEAILMPIKK